MKVYELLEVLSKVSDKGKRIIFILSGVKLHTLYLEYKHITLFENMTVRKLVSILLKSNPLCSIRLNCITPLFMYKVIERSKIYIALI